METMVNHNYRIGVDTLDTGKVRARARGRKTATKTFPEGTSHESAATALAERFEGERLASVRQVSGHYLASDWQVLVTIG